ANPYHAILDRIATSPYRERIAAYCRDLQRHSGERNRHEQPHAGVFTGAYARHPAAGNRIPVWAADYVLAEYGTGAVMGVPAHDQRDFAFATTHDLPIRAVVMPPGSWLTARRPEAASEVSVRYRKEPEAFGAAYTGPGHVVHSSFPEFSIDGLPSAQASDVIAAWLEEKGLGRRKVRYKLRDWLFSRQRYWGEPFPIVFD